MQQSTMRKLKGTHGVVGVVRSDTIHHMRYLIGFVVAVGVSQKYDAWFVNDQHPILKELKASWANKLVVKSLARNAEQPKRFVF